MFLKELRLRLPAFNSNIRRSLFCSILLIVLLMSHPNSSPVDIISDSLFTRTSYWTSWNDTSTTVMDFQFETKGFKVTVIKPGKYEYEGGLQRHVPVRKEKTYKITLVASSDSSCSLPFGFKGEREPYLRHAIRMLHFKPELDTFKLTWVNSGTNAISPSYVAICVSIGNARGILRFKKLSITEQDVSPSDVNDFECPVIPKLNPPLHESSELPSGLLAYSYSGAGTIFISPFNKWAPVGIPGINASPSNIFFSDDGKWLLYQVESEMFLTRIDGRYKTKIPVTDTITACNFYRNSPHGVEIVYDLKKMEMLRSIPVFFSDTGVSFGSSRTIADLGNNFAFENYYQISVIKDQIWGAICPVVNGEILKRSGFMTIPDSGKGIATPDNIYKFNDNNNEQVFGCSHTMSYDGNYCVANPGHAAETGDFSHCAPFQHKGFYVSRFYRDRDSAVGTREHVHRYSYSLNWCPDKYLPWEWTVVDFNLYNFTNNNRILVAAQCGDSSSRQGLWAIDWETNYWYPLNPDSIRIKASAVAGYTGIYDQSILDSLSKDTSTYSDTTVKNPIGYKIIRPYGKEIFYPGDRCTIQVYSREDGNAAIKIQFGKYIFNLRNTAINPKKDSIIIDSIRSFYLQLKKVNGVLQIDTVRPDNSDCRIRLEHYTPGVCDPILSEPFSILQKTSVRPGILTPNRKLSTTTQVIN
ncbi:MAG TPA: hypothetical protein VHO70_04920, partial [Chitinispirillaceae bacterium]|nr:hypothetical protein [Chitinispirillaceae bacterium]